MTNRKSATVTGPVTGVGAATALALAHKGYNLLINDSKSNQEAIASAAACRAAGADALLIRDDVADDAPCRNMTDATMARAGGPFGRIGEQRGHHVFCGLGQLGRVGRGRIP